MKRKLINFLTKNGILVILAGLQLCFMGPLQAPVGTEASSGPGQGIGQGTDILEASYLFLFIVARNFSLCHMIEYFTKHRPYASDSYTEPVPRFRGEFELYLLQGSALEVMVVLMSYGTVVSSHRQGLVADLLYFVPISFCVEVIFDFFHYWVHRIMHLSPRLYKLHRTHHSHYYVRPILAFYQNIIDLILSNAAPFLLTLWILQQALAMSISPFQVALLYNYKIFTEIAGHSERSSYPNCSFQQCVWLPKFLGIELCSDDHNLHHSKVQCNYAKRFSLWDKAFGTYIRPQYPEREP